ncbi:hypothetical protein NRB20_48150 [Nocardia sp. RB20]|uniref:Transposase n=1 Tax=Nocardia macrotermitis TaxID=2585198 RepID=A0A7K0D8S0_9NOCA|nr:hypothetical protein [Nocardia macrotermitis]
MVTRPRYPPNAGSDSSLTSCCAAESTHKSVAALEKDLTAWIEQWNAEPKPFVWRKTAEEILESLAEYLLRISDAAH